VCLNREIVMVVSDVCHDVEEGRAIGTLCKEFCMKNTLVPVSCQPFHGGKEIVFKATFHGNPVFVKGRRSRADENLEESLFWTDENGVEQYPTLDEFKHVVNAHLFHNFNISYNEQTFYKLWPLPLNRDAFSPTQNQMLLKLSMKTLWNLLQDSEYVFIKLFQHFDVFPEVYGTCSGLYIVEEVQSLDWPGLMEKTSFVAWARRAKIGLGILDLVEELDTMFDHPVHLCDVKPEHFGLSEHGRIKYNDVDNVYLKPIVDNSVGDGSACVKHSDCDFFDCKGQCDMAKRKCSGGVVNNNLQIVCEKIFLGKSYAMKSLGGSGLLASRHGEKVLKPLLQACANPSGSETEVRLSADNSHLKSLRKALKEIISFGERLENES